jgi:hypothetical protein
MINREEIIRIVAEKFRLIIREDDPILAVFAISDVLYEKQSEKMLAVNESESQRILKGVQGIIKEGRFDLHRERENLLQALKNENLRHEAKSTSIAKQHLEAIERITLEARKAKVWAWAAAGASFCATIGLTVFLITYF